MEKSDAIESEGIVQRTLINLAGGIRDKGDNGVQAKVMIGWVAANALSLLFYDQMGTPLDACFEIVRQAGATLPDMERVRILVSTEQPKTLGGTLVRDSSINFALAQEGKIIAGMSFTSRQDVDAILQSIRAPFDSAEETVADTMDPMDYQALIELRAAIVNHLVSSSRPLPSMLTYQFASPLPSLVISQRLYGDGSRYDEIRAENKVVHPAFCQPVGKALSS
jgi:hypothetical protein